MVGYLSGYWFGSVCVCKCNDWEDLIMGDYKQIGYGDLQLLDVDEETLSQMYPLVAANCKAFLSAHKDLAKEMYDDPAAYVKDYNKAVKEFCDLLLNQTQLFARFFEIQHRMCGLLLYQAVHIEILSEKKKELQEKLDRYENND